MSKFFQQKTFLHTVIKQFSLSKKLYSLFLTILYSAFSLAQTDSLLTPAAQHKTVIGTASFYSKSLHGTKTATGERFSNEKYTGASNNFKLNTWVKVTNLRNDKSVVVKINDRMHKKMAKRGRVIDLSRAAAKDLSFMHRGLVKVKVEQIEKPE